MTPNMIFGRTCSARRCCPHRPTPALRRRRQIPAVLTALPPFSQSSYENAPTAAGHNGSIPWPEMLKFPEHNIIDKGNFEQLNLETNTTTTNIFPWDGSEHPITITEEQVGTAFRENPRLIEML